MGGVPMVLTAAMIATATGGYLTAGSADRVVTGFAIDSRTLHPGDLFFAIVAARDGHDFVTNAFARGASGAVVSRTFEPAEPGLDPAGKAFQGRIIIHVDDTTRALQDLATFVRVESGATVVAITGSAGKTTTKEATARLLSGKYRVEKNVGNLNNYLGLPLSLLELRNGADMAVMELGMNHAGEIRRLVEIAKPQIRVWTNVGDAHLGYFESRDGVADAKGEVLEGASPSDVLVCNADDPLVMARARSFRGRVISFGMSPGADVRAESIEDRGIDGTRFRVRTPYGSADAALPLLGRANLSNVLAATAVAGDLGVALEDITARYAQLTPAPHRGAVLRLRDRIYIIDDSYNSNPTAVKRALEVVSHERRATRKAAVLGEMLELGEHSIGLHRECGHAAASAGLARLITVGGEPAKVMARAAVAGGMPAESVTWTATSDEAAAVVLAWLTPGDLLLVKGSRGIKTDLVVERIAEELS